MTNDKLFNCCANCEAPNWAQYDALTIGGCITVTGPKGDTWTEGGIERSKAEFFTVYGHYISDISMGVEAITDCPSFADAQVVAAELAKLSGLTVNVEC